MAHDYGVPLRILSVTPTRDNKMAPSDRLPDKHSRLFCGKTLDEWTMIQLWSSHASIHKVFVCETNAHANKLQMMADSYGVELLVRPEEMLHPVNDTGSIPVFWAVERELRADYFSLVTTPFVVCPCRPPGFFDNMVEQYMNKVGSPDFNTGSAIVMGGYSTDHSLYELDGSRGEQIGKVTLNKDPVRRESITNHWIAATWWYLGSSVLQFARHALAIDPIFFDIEPWMDIHIDTEDQWKEAEYWFREKILSQGEDCYERYRESWVK